MLLESRSLGTATDRLIGGGSISLMGKQLTTIAILIIYLSLKLCVCVSVQLHSRTRWNLADWPTDRQTQSDRPTYRPSDWQRGRQLDSQSVRYLRSGPYNLSISAWGMGIYLVSLSLVASIGRYQFQISSLLGSMANLFGLRVRLQLLSERNGSED